MKPRNVATFRIGDGPAQTVVGREAETIRALVQAGTLGITSLEAFKAGWAVRLSAYIYDLRRMGVPVETSHESHDGGTHARYTLIGPVTLVSVADPAASEMPEAV